jgi:hypothetical protein
MTLAELVVFALAMLWGQLVASLVRRALRHRDRTRRFKAAIEAEGILPPATLVPPVYVKHERLGHCTVHRFACGDLWVIHPTFEAAQEDLARAN